MELILQGLEIVLQHFYEIDKYDLSFGSTILEKIDNNQYRSKKYKSSDSYFYKIQKLLNYGADDYRKCYNWMNILNEFKFYINISYNEFKEDECRLLNFVKTDGKKPKNEKRLKKHLLKRDYFSE